MTGTTPIKEWQLLSTTWEFSGHILAAALKATFDRRETVLPKAAPIAFTLAFTDDPEKLLQWTAYLRKGRIKRSPSTLREATEAIAGFLMPVVGALNRGELFDRSWPAAGPWR